MSVKSRMVHVDSEHLYFAFILFDPDQPVFGGFFHPFGELLPFGFGDDHVVSLFEGDIGGSGWEDVSGV